MQAYYILYINMIACCFNPSQQTSREAYIQLESERQWHDLTQYMLAELCQCQDLSAWLQTQRGLSAYAVLWVCRETRRTQGKCPETIKEISIWYRFSMVEFNDVLQWTILKVDIKNWRLRLQIWRPMKSLFFSFYFGDYRWKVAD